MVKWEPSSIRHVCVVMQVARLYLKNHSFDKYFEFTHFSSSTISEATLRTARNQTCVLNESSLELQLSDDLKHISLTLSDCEIAAAENFPEMKYGKRVKLLLQWHAKCAQQINKKRRILL